MNRALLTGYLIFLGLLAAALCWYETYLHMEQFIVITVAVFVMITLFAIGVYRRGKR